MARLSFETKAIIAVAAAPWLWLAIWAAWHYTRIWVPLNTSLVGEPGHIQTSDFKIYLEGDYSIDIQSDTPPQVCDETLAARWSLSRNGSILAAGKGQSSPWDHWACRIGRFHADTGLYRLDLDVARRPANLVVYEDGGLFLRSTAHGAHVLTVCEIVLPLAFATLVIGAVRRREERQAAADRQWTLTPSGPLPGAPIPGAPIKVAPRRRLKQIAARMPSVAGPFNLSRQMLSIVQALALIWAVFVVCWAMERMPPHGFAIRTIRPNVKLISAAGMMPLRIRVLGSDHAERGLQIGAQMIDRADFAAFLAREIPKCPPDWPVYVDGDPDLDYGSVAWAIDAVGAFGAKVILLTPGFKADLGEPLAKSPKEALIPPAPSAASGKTNLR